MRIVIDTKQDSPEEIKHIINMLTTMIGEKMISTKTEQPVRRDIFGNIFGQPKTRAEREETKEMEERESIDIKDFKLDNMETY